MEKKNSNKFLANHFQDKWNRLCTALGVLQKRTKKNGGLNPQVAMQPITNKIYETN